MAIFIKKDLVPNRQFGLDLVRAIAITLVLLSHLVKALDYIGFWGVEFFFALSGFLIGHILWRNFSQTNNWSTCHITNFWARRWWRTLPNYYLFLIISLTFNYILSIPIPPLSKLIKFIWFGQDFIARNYGFFSISWSLCIEEWFYFLFPLLLFILSKTGFSQKRVFALTIFIIFIISAIARIIIQQKGLGEQMRAITLGRLDAIGCGVAVSFYCSITPLTAKRQLMLFLAGFFLISISVITPLVSPLSYYMIKSNPFFLVLVPLGGALTLPYCTVLKRPIFNPFAMTVESLSLWSYSIYLSHIPVLYTIYNLLKPIRNTGYGNLFTKVIGVVVTLVLSWFLFKYFETPLMHKRPRELRLAS